MTRLIPLLACLPLTAMAQDDTDPNAPNTPVTAGEFSVQSIEVTPSRSGNEIMVEMRVRSLGEPTPPEDPTGDIRPLITRAVKAEVRRLIDATEGSGFDDWSFIDTSHAHRSRLLYELSDVTPVGNGTPASITVHLGMADGQILASTESLDLPPCGRGRCSQSPMVFQLCEDGQVFGSITRRATRGGDDLRMRLHVDQGLPADLCPDLFPLDPNNPQPDWTDLVLTGSNGDTDDGHLELVPRGEVVTLRGTAPLTHTPIGALTATIQPLDANGAALGEPLDIPVTKRGFKPARFESWPDVLPGEPIEIIANGEPIAAQGFDGVANIRLTAINGESIDPEPLGFIRAELPDGTELLALTRSSDLGFDDDFVRTISVDIKYVMLAGGTVNGAATIEVGPREPIDLQIEGNTRPPSAIFPTSWAVMLD